MPRGSTSAIRRSCRESPGASSTPGTKSQRRRPPPAPALTPIRALLAQAALETGWGKHLPQRHDGSSSFNLFGIKAGGGWDGDKVSVPTLEYEGGVAVRRRDNFRAYDNPAQAFADYARMLTDNPRYAHALGQGENVAGFAHALSRGGYATDPGYAAKLTAIANSPQMREALASLRAEAFK